VRLEIRKDLLPELGHEVIDDRDVDEARIHHLENVVVFERVWRFDAALYTESLQPTENPVMRQIDRLRAAAEGGAFDPLAVWKRD
jgi:hypothetical protein